MGRLKFVVVLFALLVFAGCAKEDALLKDPVFNEVGKETNGWLIEGQGTLRKIPEGAELIAGPGAPFIYQQAPAKKKHKGGLVSLGAWIKTDVPASAYVEFSNRLGTDSRSEPHPGDGQWRLLKTTVRVPENSEILEFRIRSYGQGSTIIREASMTSGTVTGIEKDEAALDSSGVYKVAGIGTLLVLMVLTALSFRNFKDSIGVRLAEVFLLLVFMAGIMLTAGKSVNASVTSNIGWVVFALAVLVFVNSKIKVFQLIRELNGSKVLVILSLIMALVTINALKDGAIGLAEKTAKLAYFLLITSGAVLLFQKIYKAVLAKRPQKRVRLYRKPEGLVEAKEELPDGMN